MQRRDLGRSLSQTRTTTRRRPRRAAARPGAWRVLGEALATGRLASGLVLVAALAVAAYVATAPQFRIRDIRVTGVQMLDDADVIALSGAAERMIWTVDTVRIASMLAANHYVEGVSVHAYLPDRLDIAITERRPDIRWVAGGSAYLVDATGLVLGQAAAPDDSAGILAIQDLSGQPVEPGTRIDAAVLNLCRELALRLSAESGATIATLTWHPIDGVIVTTPANQRIAIGDGSRLDEKIAVIRWLHDEQIAYTSLDVRPEAPFYRTDGQVRP
jgi:cell division protein FtsQ